MQEVDRNTFRRIFEEHWNEFKERHPKYAVVYYDEVVRKMLGCGKEDGGYSEYLCAYCGKDLRRVAFTCKSGFCLSCSKGYTDDFVAQASRVLQPGVKCRHMILTVPEQLRIYFYRDRHAGKLLSALMRCGYACLEDVASRAVGRKVKIGAIVVVQTHGRSGHYNPHLHIIMSSGGIDEETCKWLEPGYFSYEIIHKKWQYHLLKKMKEMVPTEAMKSLIDSLWKKYPRGLVAYMTKGKVPEQCRGLSGYLAKYVASPPIAIRRIIDYTGQEVTCWYKDHQTKKKEVVTVDVIKEGLRRAGRIIKGTYEVVVSKKYRERFREMSGRDTLICRFCGKEMDLWKIWHPKYGTIHDECEKLKTGKYEKRVERTEGATRGGGYSLWPPAGGVQLPLYSVRV